MGPLAPQAPYLSEQAPPPTLPVPALWPPLALALAAVSASSTPVGPAFLALISPLCSPLPTFYPLALSLAATDASLTHTNPAKLAPTEPLRFLSSTFYPLNPVIAAAGASPAPTNLAFLGLISLLRSLVTASPPIPASLPRTCPQLLQKPQHLHPITTAPPAHHRSTAHGPPPLDPTPVAPPSCLF
ncbi:lysine-rich arabinogalactan protein 19-like [Cryptomeria japonica]|uniref:lysine-rich arabinogalactan protein 19-like n=1 Tax=Cryptomeria japonica TaxID=3369 RepID=UPI0027D9D17E|nr:lysine-rich arabinogalactan protein 19-like [Cryptomeria japonica]